MPMGYKSDPVCPQPQKQSSGGSGFTVWSFLTTLALVR